VINERFVAVSMVMVSRIRGCFSKPRRDFSVTSGDVIVSSTVHLMNVEQRQIAADPQTDQLEL